jgi:Domain of unknown function (DUF397)
LTDKNYAPGATGDDQDGWFVSSFTNGGGSCVEVKFATQGVVLMRDSKDRRDDRPIVGFSSEAWSSLLENVTSR